MGGLPLAAGRLVAARCRSAAIAMQHGNENDC